MGCGDRQHFAQAQLKKLGQLNAAFLHALCLVGSEQRRDAQLAQVLGNVVILGVQTSAGIHYKYDDVRLSHRLARLLGHLFVNPGGRVGLETSRVDNDVLLRTQLAIAVVSVPRQAGIVGHNRIPRFGQAVKKRRFAHIRAAHQGNYRFHQKSCCGLLVRLLIGAESQK